MEVNEDAEDDDSLDYLEKSSAPLAERHPPKPVNSVVDRNYRITPQVIEKLNQVLQGFVGTHCFWNFTQRNKFNGPKDHACFRYITDFKFLDTFVVNEIEYSRICVSGQSFIFNQIRKMLGLTILIMRGLVPQDIQPRALDSSRMVIVPLTPGFGLMLDSLDYSTYNKRYGTIHGSIEQNAFDGSVQEFKKIIHNEIAKLESDSQIIAKWLCMMEICVRYTVIGHERSLKVTVNGKILEKEQQFKQRLKQRGKGGKRDAKIKAGEGDEAATDSTSKKTEGLSENNISEASSAPNHST